MRANRQENITKKDIIFILLIYLTFAILLEAVFYVELNIFDFISVFFQIYNILIFIYIMMK